MNNTLSIRIKAAAVTALILTSGCGSSMPRKNYVISTNTPHSCCRTIRYSTTDFENVQRTEERSPGVHVRLLSNLNASCSKDGCVMVILANSTDKDIYVPISRELDGEKITMYPWRFLFVNEKPTRLARQIQFGDILEREDARLLFTRLVAGGQITLTGVVPRNWACASPSPIYEGYLNQELDPSVYAQQARAVRDASAGRKEALKTPIQFRYDVAYTTLDYFEGLPIKWRSTANDTTTIDIDLPDEPAKFLNGSLKVAESNVVTMTIDTTR